MSKAGASRLAFLGSPAVSAYCLGELAAAGHDIALVVTEPDRRRSRGKDLLPTPVKERALELGLRVTDRLADVADSGVDLGVVVAFGRIIPASLLATVPMVNLHFSLLPRWRGAAPVEQAILAGDTQTGVCVMEVEAGLDTGGVYAKEVVDIGPHETADELRERLGVIGARLLVERLADLPDSLGVPVPQDETATPTTYASKLTHDDRRLDFDRSAVEVERTVRIGGAWTEWRGERLIVHRGHAAESQTGTSPGTLTGSGVATGDGELVVEEVQAAGKRRQGFAEWFRGARPQPGERFGGVR